MKKYRFRLFVSFVFYLFFRLTGSGDLYQFFEWNFTDTIYLFYTVPVILISWEVIAVCIGYFYRKSGISSNSDLLKISIKAALCVLPFVLLFSYIDHIVLRPMCYPEKMGGIQKFWITSAQGFVLSQIIMLYEIMRLYIKYAVNNAREKEQIKKELVAAKFEGLKNQVNPHFLFNSFSVLTSLVETDPKSAVSFISKLSDMYRYILENDEKDIVTVKEELNFLDDYLFLLKMRHQTAVVVKIDLGKLDLSSKIPPMALQILVENAVKHNSFSIDDPLEITIGDQAGISVFVENKKVPKKELVHSTKIGLKNLSKRLMLSIGKGLVILEDEDRFQVTIPLTA
jgi:two-component system, LytTR family, sensor kinase